MEQLLPLIVLLPLAGALLIGLFGFISPSFRKQEKIIGALGTLMVAIPFVFVAYAFFSFDKLAHGKEAIFFDIIPWMKAGGLDLSFTYRLDQLSLLMGMIVTGIGSLIHIYSIGYMHGDRGYYKFFLYLNLFIFSMLNLILGENMAVLFLGWEGVGACSYFLIGFWYEDMPKAKAAQKAFIANRIGDFFMIWAMFLIYQNVGSLNFTDIIHWDWAGHPDLSTWVGLLVLGAATGKSAQIPLYVWLPDAMAGPTPVSALIHAATMVTSGIYLISRIHPVFLASPTATTVVCIIGGSTALMAALIAIAQNDIKKVLAYSTVSQLGFMFMALGAGAFTTAIFHVMTHAFFKACLFLGSGSVIHAMDHMHTVKDPQDVRTMGGLRKYMKSTSITFWISTLAIAGIFPLSGFFSKDEILGKVFAYGLLENSIPHYIIWVIGTVTAAMTAFYMTRVTYLTFEGKPRFPDTKKPHESPITMTLPLWILAILAAVGGFLGLPEIMDHFIGGGGHGGHDTHALAQTVAHGHEHAATAGHAASGSINWIGNNWLGKAVHNFELNMHDHVGIEIGLIAFSMFLAIGMVLFARSFYKKHGLEGDAKLKKGLGKFYTAMERKFYVDEIYELMLIKPFVFISRNLVVPFDKDFVDGIVNGLAKLTNFIGDLIKRIQTGVVTHYALIVVLGVLIILSYLIF